MPTICQYSYAAVLARVSMSVLGGGGSSVFRSGLRNALSITFDSTREKKRNYSLERCKHLAARTLTAFQTPRESNCGSWQRLHIPSKTLRALCSPLCIISAKGSESLNCAKYEALLGENKRIEGKSQRPRAEVAERASIHGRLLPLDGVLNSIFSYILGDGKL